MNSLKYHLVSSCTSLLSKTQENKVLRVIDKFCEQFQSQETQCQYMHKPCTALHFIYELLITK